MVATRAGGCELAHALAKLPAVGDWMSGRHLRYVLAELRSSARCRRCRRCAYRRHGKCQTEDGCQNDSSHRVTPYSSVPETYYNRSEVA